MLAPFAVHELEPAARGDSLGDLIHRHGAFALLDMVAQTMGWAPPATLAGPYGLPEETLLLDLGARISGAEPAHEGLDPVAQLAYEAAVGAGEDPGWAGGAPDPSWPEGDVVDALLALARADPDARVEDLVVALKDRLHTDPTIAVDERAAIETLLGSSLAQRAAEQDADQLEAGLRALAGALLRAPQFMLAGAAAPPEPQVPAPRLVLPGADVLAIEIDDRADRR